MDDLNISLGCVLKAFGGFLALVILLALLGWALGWITLPLRVVNPDTGLARWQWYYDTYGALNTTRANIETAQKSIDSFVALNGKTTTWDWQQRSEYQRLTTVRDGYITHYNMLANDYNAKMADITRSWSAPRDLPTYIPSYQSP